MANKDVIKRAGVKRLDGTYELKEFAVDCDNVLGLEERATAARAKKDENGKNIASYIAEVERDSKGIVVQDGNGESKNIDLSMEGATADKGGAAGLVPESKAGDQDKFLKANGTWAPVPNPSVVKGAQENYDGEEGLIPQPKAGDQDRVLQGSGSWGHKLQVDIIEQNGVYGYLNAEQEFVAFKSQSDIDAAVQTARQGNATAADVVEGRTFTNKNGSNLVGTMPHVPTYDNQYTNIHNYEPIIPEGEITYSEVYSVRQSGSYPAPTGKYRLTAEIPFTKSNNMKNWIADTTRLGLNLHTFGNAVKSQVLKGSTFTSMDGFQVEGTMTKNGAWTSNNLKAGQSITIPEGYHNGDGKVTAASLASQTQGNANTADILQGQTAWVNGNKITGSMTNHYKWSQTVQATTTYFNPRDTVINIPDGYHYNSKVVIHYVPEDSSGGTVGGGTVIGGGGSGGGAVIGGPF